MIKLLPLRNVLLLPVVVGLAVLVTTAFAVATEQTQMQADFDRLKSLKGMWQGTVDHGEGPMSATVTYEVTAGDSAVVETLFLGTEREMVTVYHMDGDQLVMTHYCMLGNQPMMGAQESAPLDTIEFQYIGGTSIKSENDPHMHKATFKFDGPDHLTADWCMYEKGEQASCAHLDLKRAE